jgi:aminoglycoside 3-N-acetyltransferase
MSGLRNLVRSLVPSFLLNWYRDRKKEAVRRNLEEQRRSGKGFTKEQLKEQLHTAGIVPGDTVLVHSSLSKIGFVEGGPQTIVDALLEAVGPDGHVLMPNSPNGGYQLDYIRNLEVFDVLHTPSALGAITEAFRKHPSARRSASATEPVSCVGPKAEWFTGEHFGELTPYTAKSPFHKVAAAGGKILYIGVSLANAGTSLHLLEDAAPDFRYPVYFPEVFDVKIRLANGEERMVRTKVHNPEQSAKRKCDDLIPRFREEGVTTDCLIGNAPTLVFDAQKMLEVMVRLYREEGITMYTPFGN